MVENKEEIEDMDTSPDEVSDADDNDTQKRLSAAQWEEVKARYEAGTATIQELADEFGITKSAISRKFRRDNVVKGSKAAQVGAAVAQQVAQVAAANSVSAEEERQKRIEETKKQAYQSVTMVHVLAHKMLVEQVNAGKPLEAIGESLKSLKIAVDIFEKTKTQRYHILGIDADHGDDEMPSILIQDLSDDEIAELRSSQEEEDGDLADLDMDLETDE